MNNALSTLWLWFWRLLPANPILVRVVSSASKRSRHLWLRAGYLIALLSVVLGVLWYNMTSREGVSLTELAKGASQTFKLASTAQLLLMCFLAPVFTASAITQEKDAQTYNILLTTPLSNAQIVLGTLMSRLYFVLLLLLSGLPIFLMTMVYGGVTARQIIQSIELAGATAIFTGALAIFVAMFGVGTRRTIFSFYLLIALYLLAFYMLGQWDQTWVSSASANLEGRKMSWLAPFHPFLALDVALHRVAAPDPGALTDQGSFWRACLSHPAETYVTWTILVSLLLVLISLFFVRRAAKAGEGPFASTFLRRLSPTTNEKSRAPRSVWHNPVAWREAKTHASSGALVRWVIVAIGAAASLWLLLDYVRGSLAPQSAPEWLASIIMIQFALALLVATNTAATSMTKEREAKTMELLLTTPLTPQYILWEASRLVSFTTPLLVGPVVVLLIFAAYDLIRGASPTLIWISSAVELGAIMVVWTGVACVVGLRFSLLSRTNMVAVMSSVGVLMLLCGIASAIGFAVVQGTGGEFGAVLAPFTPFTAIWYLVNPLALHEHSLRQLAEQGRATQIAALLGSALAVLVYAFAVWRWYVGLVRDFDMTLRKQSSQ